MAILAVIRMVFSKEGTAMDSAGMQALWGKMPLAEAVLDALPTWFGSRVDMERVGIMGHSYGGYAALAALAFSPDEFACGIDEMGPANLLTLLQTAPEYWAPTLGELKKLVGDWEKDPDSLHRGNEKAKIHDLNLIQFY